MHPNVPRDDAELFNSCVANLYGSLTHCSTVGNIE